jgi:type I restriction enzyme S subunit
VHWGEVGLAQNGRSFPSKHYQDEGVKLLRPGNMKKDGSIRWNPKNTEHLPESFADQYPDYVLRGGELIMNLTAQSLKDAFLGRICMTTEGEYCLLNQRLAKLTPVRIRREYMFWLFKSPMFRNFVADGLNTGTLIQHMYTSEMESFVLPLPPLAEQAAIARSAERYSRVVSSVRRSLKNAVGRRNSLDSAVLNSAFSVSDDGDR